jgi:LmbE family N-acetylglucosaminyl deacetylase
LAAYQNLPVLPAVDVSAFRHDFVPWNPCNSLGAEVTIVEPKEVFQGVVLIAVPHMDDEVLACGGTIAKLPEKERIHLIYATDGMKAPEPILPWCDTVSPELGAIRRRESKTAMMLLGVPEGNVYFLNLPEGRLERNQEQLFLLMSELIGRIKPHHILLPFRYDRHRDHVALNRVVTAASLRALEHVQLSEYFVYYRWRLLPKGDVRKYLHAGYLLQVDIGDVSARKRAALECFKSQTTRFYPWQARPNLTPKLLDEVSNDPEFFLRYNPSLPGPLVFASSATWIRLAHRLESPLKRVKDRVVAVWRRMFTRTVV